MASQDDVGLGVAAPIVELRMADSDAPTLRPEQNVSNGWIPQARDVAGNETNFFVRDGTNGSKLPFKSNGPVITSCQQVAIRYAAAGH